MTEATHTPGPWSKIREIVWAEPKTLANGGVFHQPIADCLHSGGIPLDEMEANARLIAAAPDMLKALRRISQPRDCGCRPCRGQCTDREALLIEADEMRAIARTAIAKTEGR